MRTWLTFLALATFLPQQFTCCVEACSACGVPEECPAERSPCQHHGHDHDGHDHEDGESPPLQPGGTSHHLCVGTHLFYLASSHSSAAVPSFSLWHPVVPEQRSVLHWDRSRAGLQWIQAELPLPDNLRLRTRLNVWIV